MPGGQPPACPGWLADMPCLVVCATTTSCLTNADPQQVRRLGLLTDGPPP